MGLFKIWTNFQLFSYNNNAESRYYYETKEPIDVVYTWVNGSDSQFLKNLNTFLHNNDKMKEKDVSYQRFDDKYELKFSLR